MEAVGLVVVVALAMAALALWLPAHADLPRHPPADLRVAVAPPAPPPTRRVLGLWSTLRYRWPDDWSRAGLRRWYDGAPLTVHTALLGVVLADGAGDELREEVEAVSDDPAGWLEDAARPPGPEDLRRLVQALRAAPAYVREVRRMGYRRGSERVAHDLGRLAAEGGIQYVTRGRSIRRLVRRLPRPGGRVPRAASGADAAHGRHTSAPTRAGLLSDHDPVPPARRRSNRTGSGR